MVINSPIKAKDGIKIDEQPNLKRANLLLDGAMTLLALMTAIKYAEPPTTLEEFRVKILAEIKAFELYLAENGYAERIILAARYCICTAIDEKVFTTSWGAKSRWLQQGLLSTLYQEVNGGEKFYLITEVLLEKPLENLDLLEFIYFILNLGFKGKFYQDEKALETFRHRLFRTLAGFKTEEELLSQGKAQDMKRASLYTFSFLTIVTLIGSLLLAFSLHLKYHSKQYADHIYALLEKPSDVQLQEREPN